VNLGELDSLFEQFFALVEVTVRLPPGTERRSAFRDLRDYGSRIDQVAVRLLKQSADLNRTAPHSKPRRL
jgi:hypothetical protein